MAASKTITLSSIGSGGPPLISESVGGPQSDVVATPIQVTNSITLSSSFAQITVPAGATRVTLSMVSGNAINITIAGGNTDTGINLGSGWTWTHLPILGGTATLWVKSASGTPVLYYEFN